MVDHSNEPGGPLAYYEDGAKVPYHMVSPVLFGVLTLLGDCFMVNNYNLSEYHLFMLFPQTYRIYVVWRCKLASLMLPVLFIVGGLGVS